MTPLPPPEFSRRVSVDAIGVGGHSIGITATPEECAALARRFGWSRIERIGANARLLARADGVDALGTLSAAIERPCVATGDPVCETIEEAFAIHFVHSPEGNAADGGAAGEIELNEDDLDVVEFDGAAVDIGEAVAQSLALAPDPFPRSAEATAKLRAAGVLPEDEVVTGPFAVLKNLLNDQG